MVIALNRTDGSEVWRRTLHRALPHEGGHISGSLASASPVTNGRYLFAHFGSYGLYCLDREGNEIWRRDLGRMHSKHGHGEGSSPAQRGLAESRRVVQLHLFVFGFFKNAK